MKSTKLFLVACALLASAGAASAQTAPALYSFEDIYRLALAGPTGPAMQDSPRQNGLAPDPAIRVAALQAAPGAEPHFTVEPLPGPRGWLLLLAGIAAAAWV